MYGRSFVVRVLSKLLIGCEFVLTFPVHLPYPRRRLTNRYKEATITQIEIWKKDIEFSANKITVKKLILHNSNLKIQFKFYVCMCLWMTTNYIRLEIAIRAI